jgi:hypothetical protein
MEVLPYDDTCAEEWDTFVRRHPLAGYGHLAANFALAGVTPGTTNASLIVRDGRTLVGVLPLFEQRAHVLRAISVRSLVSGAFFPAGPLLSPNLRGKAEAAAMAALLDAVGERAKRDGIDRVVIGYPNITDGQPTISRIGYSPLLHHGYHATPGVGLAVDLGQAPEQIAAGRKSGCRQAITKAQSAGVTAMRISERDEWLACHALNVHTLGPLALSLEQMSVIWDRFIAAGDATAFAVHADGAIAAVTTIISANGAAYYWHGWRSAVPVNGASHLGLWTAILAARDAGCRAFELGSIEFQNSKNIGISQFKQSFGGTPFQTLSAQLDVRPVKSAAIALAEAAAAVLRARRRRPAAAPASPAPMATAAVART